MMLRPRCLRVRGEGGRNTHPEARSVRLVFGLGNPGREYEGTRHNVGFDVVDFLARREGVLFEPAQALERFEGPLAFRWARLHEPDALLVKPTTFMNRSGTV